MNVRPAALRTGKDSSRLHSGPSERTRSFGREIERHPAGRGGRPNVFLSASTRSRHTHKGTNDVMGQQQSYSLPPCRYGSPRRGTEPFNQKFKKNLDLESSLPAWWHQSPQRIIFRLMRILQQRH
jgi:hypothetical protein